VHGQRTRRGPKTPVIRLCGCCHLVEREGAKKTPTQAKKAFRYCDVRKMNLIRRCPPVAVPTVGEAVKAVPSPADCACRKTELELESASLRCIDEWRTRNRLC
jgi:hypothetical protein